MRIRIRICKFFMRLIVFPSDLFNFFFGRIILISFNPRPRAFRIGQFRLRNAFPLSPRTLTFDPSSCFVLCFAIYIVSTIQLMVLSVQRCLLPLILPLTNHDYVKRPNAKFILFGMGRFYGWVMHL